MDFSIATESSTINLQAVPLFVLPGPKGDILLGTAQQEELGMTSTRRLMAQAVAQLKGVVIARDPLDVNGTLLAAAGPPVQKLMRLTLVAEDGEESMEDECANEESEDEDLSEEDLLEEHLCRDTSEEMTRELELMLWRAMNNGLPMVFQERAHALIEDYHDVFRLELGMDPPAKVTPLRIELIDKSIPERRWGRLRTFAPLQRQFLDEHMKLLLKIWVIEKCNANEAALIVLVRKNTGE